MKRFLFLFFLLAACGPNSPEDYQKEGEALLRKLSYELEKIHTREDLAKALPKVKKSFHEIVDLMIGAKTWKEEHPEMIPAEPNEDTLFVNESVKFELKRIYRLEGGKEMIEKAQREELIRYDGFLASRKKQLQLESGSRKSQELKKEALLPRS